MGKVSLHAEVVCLSSASWDLRMGWKAFYYDPWQRCRGSRFWKYLNDSTGTLDSETTYAQEIHRAKWRLDEMQTAVYAEVTFDEGPAQRNLELVDRAAVQI